MNDKLIAKLNACLAHEWTGVAQYSQMGFMVSGLWREPYAEMFFDSAKESFGHARRVGDKIAAMGGVPTLERNKVQVGDDIYGMLKHALEFEQTAVKHYMEALAMADGVDRPLVVLLEEILLEEQDGVDQLSRIIREQGSAASTEGHKKSKTG